jgi:hypothetical protein
MRYEYKQFHRRKLPHIHSPGASLFVTFRLAGSIPKSVLNQWKQDRAWLDNELARVAKENRDSETIESANQEGRLRDFHRRWFRKFEDILDKAEHGPTWLKDPRVAELVAESLKYRDGKVYTLNAFCIMWNHVHGVFTPFLSERSLQEKPTARGLLFESTEAPLDVIMHSLKVTPHTRRIGCCNAKARFGQRRVTITKFEAPQSFEESELMSSIIPSKQA